MLSYTDCETTCVSLGAASEGSIVPDCVPGTVFVSLGWLALRLAFIGVFAYCGEEEGPRGWLRSEAAVVDDGPEVSPLADRDAPP